MRRFLNLLVAKTKTLEEIYITERFCEDMWRGFSLSYLHFAPISLLRDKELFENFPALLHERRAVGRAALQTLAHVRK
jgi:hypothetical protein